MRKIVLLFCFSLLTACEYKELCYDHNHIFDVEVAFDWQLSPTADAAGMTVLFYNMDAPSTPYVRYDLGGMQGGKVKLAAGRYRALAFNNDTETILYRDMDRIETIEAYTRNSSIEEGTQITTRSQMPQTKAAEDEPVILEPDMLWGGSSAEFTVKADGSITPVRIMPQQRVQEVTVTIRNLPNLQYASQFGGAMSGLAPAVNMLTGERVVGKATQAFEVKVEDATTLKMSFLIFGPAVEVKDDPETPPQQSEEPDTEAADNHLTIYAVLSDGSQWYYTTEISSQVPDPRTPEGEDTEIYIEVEDIPVPKPIVNGSGFQPTIDDWQSIEIPVGMPDND